MSSKRPCRSDKEFKVVKLRRQPKLLPSLPTDIWIKIARTLPLGSLANFCQTGSLQKEACEVARDALIWSVLGIKGYAHGEGTALCKLLRLLDTTPSLQHKKFMLQWILMVKERFEARNSDKLWNVTQAQVYLGVNIDGLIRFNTSRIVTTTFVTRTRGVELGFLKYPPDENDEALFGLKTVLKAARATHGNFLRVYEFVKVAVRNDERRFERATIAMMPIKRVASEFGVALEEIRYVLISCESFVEYTRGNMNEATEEFTELAKKLFAVYTTLREKHGHLLFSSPQARSTLMRTVRSVTNADLDFDVAEIVDELDMEMSLMD